MRAICPSALMKRASRPATSGRPAPQQQGKKRKDESRPPPHSLALFFFLFFIAKISSRKYFSVIRAPPFRLNLNIFLHFVRIIIRLSRDDQVKGMIPRIIGCGS